MKTLRETILSQSDLTVEAVATPEWKDTDGKVFVRTLNAKVRMDTLELFSGDDRSIAENVMTMVVVAACDGDGQPLFTDEDAAALYEKSGVVLYRIAAAARVFNCFTEAAAEEAVKNSEQTTPDDSPSS